MTNLELVDANLQPLSNVVIGEKIYLKATWDTSAMSGNESYYVRFSVNGVSLESDVINATAGGASGYYWWHTGWYAGNTTQNINVEVDRRADGSSTISETNENDNSRSLTFTPITASPPQKLTSPLTGNWYSQYAFSNYHDVDPTSGVRDYAGGSVAYNGHDAYDIGVYSTNEMDTAIPVYAAADGTVSVTNDGEFDRQNSFQPNTVLPNYVRIDHGSGWSTQYLHLRRDSVRVSVGQVVKKGALLGYMGSSGSSTDPHLHFGLYRNGSPVETMYAPSNYWISAPGSVFNTRSLRTSGITNYTPEVKYDSTDDLWEGVSKNHSFSQISNQNTIAYANYSGLRQGDVISYEWVKPDGSTYATRSNNTLTRDYSWSSWYHIATLPNVPDLGTWQVRFRVNNVLYKTETFTVTAGGAPELRVSEVAGDAIVTDNRHTPFDFGKIAVGGANVTKSFTVKNHGSAALSISSVSVPAGFVVTDSLVSSLAPGASDTLTIALSGTQAGYYGGQVRIVSNDSDEGDFTFSVEGRVSNAETLLFGIGDRYVSESRYTMGRVQRSGSTAGALTVSLASGSTADISVPASVVIPAGKNSASFLISVLGDAVAESLETIQLTATASNFPVARNTISVVNGAAVNAAPVLSLSGTVGYTRGAAAVTLAPSASVIDVDTSVFTYGKLTVAITQGISTSNALDISGLFAVSGNDLRLNGTSIGTITKNGLGTNNLEIVFKNTATITNVQQLIRSIRFRTLAGATAGNRSLTFQVTDGSGGVSNVAGMTVAVA